MAKTLRSIVNDSDWVNVELTSGTSWADPGDILDGRIWVTACGGGASGGIKTTPGDGGGGGGGAGCVVNLEIWLGRTPSFPITYAIGTGGAGKAANVAGAGFAGGDTSFGNWFVCEGGKRGGSTAYGGDGGAVFRGNDDNDAIVAPGTGGSNDAIGNNGANYLNKYVGGGGGGGGALSGGAGKVGGNSYGLGGEQPNEDGGSGGGSLGFGGVHDLVLTPGAGAGSAGGDDTDASSAGGDGVILIRYLRA